MNVARKPTIQLGVALLAAIASANAMADMIVDDFSSVGSPNPWPVTITSSSQSAWIVETGLTGVLGQVRVSSTHLWGSWQTPEDYVSVSVHDGMLDFYSTPGAGMYWAVAYGTQSPYINLGGEAGIRIEFAAFGGSNQANMTVVIAMRDVPGIETALALPMTKPGAQTLEFNFADFSKSNDFNFAAIQVMVVVFNVEGNPGINFQASEVSTFIPAPGTLGMLLLAGLRSSRRRRA